MFRDVNNDALEGRYVKRRANMSTPRSLHTLQTNRNRKTVSRTRLKRTWLPSAMLDGAAMLLGVRLGVRRAAMAGLDPERPCRL